MKVKSNQKNIRIISNLLWITALHQLNHHKMSEAMRLQTTETAKMQLTLILKEEEEG